MDKFKLNGFKIAPRLAVLFVLFGVVPATGVFVSFEMSKDTFKDAFRKPIAQMATSIGDVIDRNLFERYGDVQAFGLNAAVREPANWRNPSDANPLVVAMNGYTTGYGIYSLMMLVDPSGQVLAVNSVDAKGNPADTSSLYEMNFAGASWFQKALKGEFLEGSNGLTGTAVEQPRRIDVVAAVAGGDGYSIPFAAPVKDANGSVIGIWVNFADFGLVEEIAGSFYKALADDGKQNGEITILDPQGKIIVDYDPLGQGWSEYKRNPKVIGKFNLAEIGVDAAVRAVKGETGSTDATHARKKIVQASGFAHTAGAYDYPGLGWSVLVRIPADEAYVAITTAETVMGILILISGVLILVLGFLMGRSVAAPIKGMTGYMGKLAHGDLESEVPALDRKDEIGQMATSVQVFKENAIEKVALEQRQEADKARAEEEKRTMMHSLADEFEKAVGEFVEGLGSTATELQSAAQTLTAAAEETSSQSTAVSAASEEASTNAHSVASAVEELSASVQEIAQQISSSSDISQQAVGEAHGATENIESLALAAQKIGEVVNLINDIAEQTNLLALNATIEAARAGEAGKGFAVVASEVKQLAEQTAKATSQIADQIAQMQEATEGSVSSIQGVSTVIEKINEIGTGVAASVEEQNSATEEIARNVQESAAASAEVSSNITSVSRAAEETGAAATQVLAGSNEISDKAARLRAEVGNFLEKVRAA